ncbi:MAG: hypothetical protein MK066_03880 [Crocinitomicaceae bacterium]|nr:hypothetical protein [Crocinitomicaceae bacterium]
MKKIKIIATIFMSAVLLSCGSSSISKEANADGFASIETDVKNQFGSEAYYTDFVVTYDKSIGNIISTTVTDDPESLKMGEWNQVQGAWNQTSDVTIELPEGTKATDFMFQLDDEINLKTLGGLIEKSMKKLKLDKKIENPKLEMAFIKFPDDGDISETEYCVKLEPENGGTSFNFSYKLNSELIEMDY